MEQTNTTVKRIQSFDMIRIIGALLVIMIHTSAPYVIPGENNSSAFVWGNLFDSISRCAVPLFIMMSGALMLNQEKEILPQKMFKAAGNIFILLVLWSVFYTVGYNILKPLVYHEPISPAAIADTLFNGHYHLWYLFVLISLYLATPILRFFIKKENKKLIEWYLGFAIIIGFCVPLLNQLTNIFIGEGDHITRYIENFRFDYIFEYITYYIVGWYLVNYELTKTKRILLYLLGALGVILSFTATQFLFTTQQAGDFYGNNSIQVFLYSTAVFVWLHTYFQKKNTCQHKWIGTLAGLTFGVYMSHCVFLFVFKQFTDGIACTPVAILITFLATAVCTFVFTFVLSKIPLFKKLIRC